MTHLHELTVRDADWHRDGARLQAIRRAVFIDEQGVPEDLEWDAADAVSLHALALTADGEAIATGRLLPDGHIGRMAVLRPYRGRGAGRAILQWLLDRARAQGHAAVILHAQSHALGFYARAGFVPSSAEFMEAGIPHRQMTLRL